MKTILYLKTKWYKLIHNWNPYHFLYLREKRRYTIKESNLDFLGIETLVMFPTSATLRIDYAVLYKGYVFLIMFY